MMTTPTWTIKIRKPIHLKEDTAEAYVLQGDGAPPVAELLIAPPPPPPAKPPEKPPVDTTIYVFPPQPPLGHDDPAQRNYTVWTTPEGDHFYATATEFRNPLPTSHLLAGTLPGGKWPDFTVAPGTNLWVPDYAGQRYPGEIRRLLRGEVL